MPILSDQTILRKERKEALEDLLSIGQRMRNVLYVVASKGEVTLDQVDSMQDLQAAWDVGRSRFSDAMRAR